MSDKTTGIFCFIFVLTFYFIICIDLAASEPVVKYALQMDNDDSAPVAPVTSEDIMVSFFVYKNS